MDAGLIEIRTEKEPLLIGCVYRSPSDDVNQKECMESSRKVSRLIKSAFSKNENVLIAGDFNYKEINWFNDCAPPEKEHLTDFIEPLQECYLYQHVTEPTRHRKDETPSLLDLVLTSEEGMVQEIQYLPPLGESDHVCLRFKVFTAQQKSESSIPYESNIRKTNYASVREELSKHNWEEELVSTFEKDYNIFIDFFLSYVDKHSPLKIQPKTRKNIFMTNAALRLRNKKQRMRKRYITTRTNHDKFNYNRCKNDLRSLTRKLRRDFEHNLARNVKTNPTLFWKCSRSKTKQRIPSLRRPDGSNATSPKEKSEALSDFFSSVFTKEDVESLPTARPYHFEESLTTMHIKPEFVCKKLKELNPNKSPGYDKCHPHLLKELADDICSPLATLYNKSLKWKALNLRGRTF